MTTKHHMTHADEVYSGAGYDAAVFAANGRKGARRYAVTKLDLGTPDAADADLIIDDATSTELPNTETVTYTTADDGTSPFDNGDTPAPSTITTSTGATASVWALDVPRNLSVVVTHGSSVVAMTVVVTGYDYWKKAVSETFSITATGTSKTATGDKAFAYIESIAITAAADAEANTMTLGTGNKLGLPYRLNAVEDLIQAWVDGTPEIASGTTVAGDATTATATTGDVRGTYTPSGTIDGGNQVTLWAHVDGSTAESLIGVAQYGG